MCRVLILDDTERYADSLARMINGFGNDGEFTAEFSTTIEEAHDLAKLAVQTEKPYTIFLVDYDLKARKDGIDVIQELRESSPYTSAILLTAYGDHDVGIRAFEAGVLQYLTKPIEYPDLEFALKVATIQNASLNEKIRSQKVLETALYISEIIGTELEIEKIMTTILEKLQELFQDTAQCVLLYKKDENILQFAPQTLQYYKIHNPEFKDIRFFPLDKKKKGSIASKTARKTLASKRQEFIYVEDVNNDPDYLPLNPSTTSELCVSLVSEKKLLGILALEREGRLFNDEDINLMKTISNQLALAIERSNRSEELAFKSTVATMTAWASDIAHDINREVQQIRGNAHLIRAYSKDAEILSFANDIEESGKILSSVGPWSTQRKEKILLDEYLQREVQKLAHPIGLTADFNLSIPNAYIQVNPNEFLRVLRHLVRNASRAMNNFCRSDKKRILVSTKMSRGKGVEIIVEDYGPGIDDNTRAAIFHRKVGDKLSSGGYGLLFVRQLVDDMEGKINLLPQQVEKGAIFSIKLPLVEHDPGNKEME